MENNKIKRVIVSLICMVLMVSMVGCAGEDTTSESTTTQNDSVGESVLIQNEVSAEADSNATWVDSEITELESKYSGLEEDELTWEYNTASKTIVISGEGPMRDYLGENEPEWYQYCNEAEKIVIGDEVTSIGAAAFAWFSVLTDVEIGEAVEYIGNFAFCDCYELRKVNFPINLKYVGEEAFLNALLHSENGFVFPEGMHYIGKKGFFSAFKESFVSIPASITYLGTDCFANCFVEEFRVDASNENYFADEGILYDKDVTTLMYYPAMKTDALYEIPGSVTTILQNAIEVTSDLETISIPANVSLIEEGSIYWNYKLSNIEVDENNANYKSVDGVLFTKDGKKIICYPVANPRTEYTIPDGCERICEYAISQAANLSELHVCDGVTQIGYSAFYFCNSMTKLGLPKTLTNVEESAFSNCFSLEEINYTGSAQEWQNVIIEEDNAPLTDGSVPVYFTK